jgi:hypothetical protein
MVVTPASNILGTVLVVVMGVLLVLIGFLAAYLLFERRLSRLARLGIQGAGARPQSQRSPAATPIGSPAAATICPACRREFEGGLRYCPHDAKTLVPRGDDVAKQTSGGLCPRCRRAYDPGQKVCPYDAEELIPIAFWEATHGRAAPAGVIAKICPTCGSKYDLEATFCGQDGGELVPMN